MTELIEAIIEILFRLWIWFWCITAWESWKAATGTAAEVWHAWKA
jgi:hypothetical protein